GDLLPPPPPAGGFETRTPTGFDSRTPAQPIGRMARPDTPLPAPPAPAKTVFGVPAAPGTFDINLDSGTFTPEQLQRPTGASSGAGAPPPVPPVPPAPPAQRSTLRQGPIARPPGPPQMTAQLPTINRPPEPRKPQPLPPTLPPVRPAAPRAPAAVETDELPEWNTDSEIRTNESWLPKNPASTQPMAPTSPI